MPFFEKEKKTMPKMPNKSISFIGAIIVSFVISGTILEKFMLCLNATNSGVTHVVLGYDIGYFIFIQPFIQYILYYIVYAIVGLTVYAVLYYIVIFNENIDIMHGQSLSQSDGARLLAVTGRKPYGVLGGYATR